MLWKSYHILSGNLLNLFFTFLLKDKEIFKLGLSFYVIIITIEFLQNEACNYNEIKISFKI